MIDHRQASRLAPCPAVADHPGGSASGLSPGSPGRSPTTPAALPLIPCPIPPLHPRHDPGTPATPPAFRLYRQRLPALSFCLVRSVIHTGSAAQYATMQPAARPPFWFRKHPEGSRSDFFSLIPEHSAGKIIEDRRRQDFRPAPYPLPPPWSGPSGGPPPLRGAAPGSVFRKFWILKNHCLTTITHRKYNGFLTLCYIYLCFSNICRGWIVRVTCTT